MRGVGLYGHPVFILSVGNIHLYVICTLLLSVHKILLSPFIQALKGMAATFRVTSSQIIKTAAERRLPSTDSVLTMLKWIERHFAKRFPRDTNGNGNMSYHKALTEEMKIPLSLPSASLPVKTPD